MIHLYNKIRIQKVPSLSKWMMSNSNKGKPSCYIK
jgi:hypothetical protein